MRVLFIATKPKPDNMEYHITQTLTQMGHEVFEFDIKTIFNLNASIDRYAQYFTRTFLREPERIREKALIDYARKTAPDLVLVLLGNLISPKTIALLRKTISAPIVCWCQDAMHTIGRQYIIGAPYDHVFLKDRYMVNLFNDMVGNRFSFLAEACNPSMHFSEPPSSENLESYECDVTTAASLYYFRQEILGHLHGRYKVKIWGDIPDWLEYKLGGDHTKKYIIDKQKRYAFSAAKIVLNTLIYSEIESVNCRFFEIPGCGGFQLVSHKPEVSEFFDIGKEVDTFHNKDELIEKIEFYLKEPELRSSIAKNGMMRAHREHTYQKRLESLINQTMRL